jgi:hypothetical protein
MNQSTLQSSRLAIGLAQGFFLYLLYEAFVAKAWPATNAGLFGALLSIGFFVPLVAISALGTLPVRNLLIWLAIVAAVCAALGFYDIFRLPLRGYSADLPRVLPEFGMLALAGGLFVGQTLVVAADADQRWLASYQTYFEVAWKHAVQVALAFVFVGALWALLFLGAGLFDLIKIDFVSKLLKKPLFWIPVTAVGTAYALQLTDVRSDIVRGARTLLLVLLSWLLPVITVFTVCFFLALPFTGLEPLWNTRIATQTILLACASLIFLFNASYQDGRHELAVPLRYFRFVAAIVLLPLVAIAAYGLALRVGQYGWTPSRVLSAACVFMATWYSVGYLYAAIRSGFGMRAVESTNLSAAFALIAVLLVISTPIADPVLISVKSQLARLEQGQVSPENFDYNFLRFQSGRYGLTELRKLAARIEGPATPAIASRAKEALLLEKRPQYPGHRPPPSIETQLSSISVFYPKGRTFPREFLEQDWSSAKASQHIALPRCINGWLNCAAAFVDLNDDGKDELLLFESSRPGFAAAFNQSEDGHWVFMGQLNNSSCRGFNDFLAEGKIELLPPRLKEIWIGEQRVQVLASCAPIPPQTFGR